MKIFTPALMAGLLMGHIAMAQTVNDDPTGPQPKLPTEALTIKTSTGKAYQFTVEHLHSS